MKEKYDNYEEAKHAFDESCIFLKGGPYEYCNEPLTKTCKVKLESVDYDEYGEEIGYYVLEEKMNINPNKNTSKVS